MQAMKKHLLVMIYCATLISCSKDNSYDTTAITETPGNTSNISPVPNTFTQKVLLEIFTGAGQPQSTDGTARMNDLINANSNQAIPLCIHYSDAMEIPVYSFLETTFCNSVPPAFPSAMINRIPSTGIVTLNRTQWQSNFNINKQKVAKCGLAIETNVSGTNATITVHAGFNQTVSANHNITVYLVENNIVGNGNQFEQRNSYNTIAGHAFYQAGDPILNFQHNYVIRKVLSANSGDEIRSSQLIAGGKEVKTYTTSISSYKQDDLYVIAFVNKTGATSTTHEIMNVQRVKLGSTKDWD